MKQVVRKEVVGQGRSWWLLVKEEVGGQGRIGWLGNKWVLVKETKDFMGMKFEEWAIKEMDGNPSREIISKSFCSVIFHLSPASFIMFRLHIYNIFVCLILPFYILCTPPPPTYLRRVLVNICRKYLVLFSPPASRGGHILVFRHKISVKNILSARRLFQNIGQIFLSS